ncbi:protein yippee-like At3g11230 [Amaranthus tricolor]|uniref:protein yippee-like At3g11230 n=1 Tax=Amaranthus tricolor TaxID=29722 RepID=UPI0025856B87|nr:protein yippee-like At3g11230 [Amaranthus tricolor]
MGRLFLVELKGQIYSCKNCHTHLGLADDLISTSFHIIHGTVYLFDKIVNISVSEKEDRVLMTEMRRAVEIFCVKCGSAVGWKYKLALHKKHKYIEGKVILESGLQVVHDFWFDNKFYS